MRIYCLACTEVKGRSVWRFQVRVPWLNKVTRIDGDNGRIVFGQKGVCCPFFY